MLSVATAQSCSHICGKFSKRFTRREKNTIVHYSHRQPPATHTLFAFLFLLFHFRAATFLSILQEYGCQQKYISRILGLHSRRHTPFCAFVSSFQTHTTTFAVNYKRFRVPNTIALYSLWTQKVSQTHFEFLVPFVATSPNHAQIFYQRIESSKQLTLRTSKS